MKERDGWGEEREGEISPFLDRKKVKGKEGGRGWLVREGGKGGGWLVGREVREEKKETLQTGKRSVLYRKGVNRKIVGIV